MKKINLIFYILAIISFQFNIFSTSNTLKNIGNDFNNDVYLYIGQKEYSKEIILKYYKQTLRYINYFIFFYDFERIEETIR